jgi:PPIC-type PPIASE domain
MKAYVAQKQLPPLEDELRAQCRQQYEQAILLVMKDLVEERWHILAAQDAGFSVSSVQVMARIRQLAAGPGMNLGVKEYATQNGVSLSKLEQQTRNQLIMRRLRAQAVAKTISSAQVSSYYQAHKDTYIQQETRDIDLVLTTTKARAQKAKQGLQHGQSAASLRVKLAGNSELESAAVRLSHLTENDDRALWEAAARARPGLVVGPGQTIAMMWREPIEGGNGFQGRTAWFALRLRVVHRAHNQSLAEVARVIRTQLQDEVRMTVDSHYQVDFRKHWVAKTHCAAGYVFPGLCANAGAEANAAALSEPEPEAQGELGGESEGR